MASTQACTYFSLAAQSARSQLQVTFQPNKSESVHRWYPYVEGFSGKFVSAVLEELGISRGRVFDPFGGCGTTAVEASLRGLDSLSVDVNPFMCFVAETKSRLRYSTRSVDYSLRQLREEQKDFGKNGLPTDIINPLFADKAYFSKRALEKIAFLKWKTRLIEDKDTRAFFQLALASILVRVSNLKRAPDLKYRDETEHIPDPFDIFFELAAKMREDLDKIPKEGLGEAAIICDNIKSPTKLFARPLQLCSVAITSPPYLNGTNYCRNTKLEQWILDFFRVKEDLARLRRETITAGINSVQMDKPAVTPFDRVNRIVRRIAKTAYDPRIPIMVAAYFQDMFAAMANIKRVLARRAYLVMVIGDSFFGETHIPTDAILSEIADLVGFQTMEIRRVRARKSRSGYPLRESVLVMRKAD